jgi:hypothetical protein
MSLPRFCAGAKRRCKIIPMTTEQLCKSTGLTPRKAETWIESGLIEPIAGRRREFGDDQIERVRLIQALQDKGVALAQLAGRNLAFRNDERFVIFDGQNLRVYPDAAAAIAAVVRAKRW